MKNNEPGKNINQASGFFFQNNAMIKLEADSQNQGPSLDEKTKNEDGFLIKPFRILSATLAWVFDTIEWAPFLIDILPEPLKAAVPLAENLPLQKDHRENIDSNIGDIRNVQWSENTPGLLTAGINGNFYINRKLDDDTAVRVENGHIRCCSAGIEYSFIKSHPNLNAYDFKRFQGMEIDGQKVRRIITSISFREVSLVLIGADPDAHSIQALSMKYYPKQENKNNSNKEVNVLDLSNIKKKLAELSGVEVMTDQQMFDALNRITADLAETNHLKELNTALTLQVANLQTFKAAADARQATLKDQVKGLLQAQGKTPSALELKVIEAASLDELETMHSDLKKETMAAGNFRCPHCNEAITSLQSSVAPAPGAPGEPGEPGKEKQVTNLPTIHDSI